MWYRFVAGLIALVTAAGCAGSSGGKKADSLLPEIDVVQVKENSDEALRLAQEAKLDVEMANTKLMEIDNRLVLLREDVSSVSIAKIEELEHKIALLVEALKDIQSQIDALEVSPRVRKKRSGPATFKPASASGILSTTPEYDAYQHALRVFNARNYTEARKLFFTLLKEHPRGKFADNAQYWIGECYYALGDFAQAISAFKKVFGFTNSTKADDAQYKTAKAYLSMGQKAIARSEWEKLLTRYPSSEYVPRVKKALADLN